MNKVLVLRDRFALHRILIKRCILSYHTKHLSKKKKEVGHEVYRARIKPSQIPEFPRIDGELPRIRCEPFILAKICTD